MPSAQLIIALLGGFAYRFRGGALHTQLKIERNWPGRSTWAVWLGALVFVLTQSWLAAALAVVGGYLGAIQGHASHMDVGRAADGQPADGQIAEWYARRLPLFLSPIIRDSLALIIIQLIRGALVAAPAAISSPLASISIMCGAFLSPGGYILAAHTPLGEMKLGKDLSNFVEWGEFFTGLIWGVVTISVFWLLS